MAIGCCLLVVLNSSSNFCISICIQPVEVVLEIEITLLKILTNSVEALGISFICCFHEILKSFSHVFGETFPLLVKNSKNVEN